MSQIVESCLECIGESTIKDLNFDWEDNQYTIIFLSSNSKHSFRFYRTLFGIFSNIEILEDGFFIIKSERLSNKNFKKLKKAFDDRIDFLNSSKFNSIFKNVVRNNKINQIIK